MNIEKPFAVYRNFRDLFVEQIGAEFGERHRYSIPSYQRSYDWGRSQRKDLFDDLQQLDQLVGVLGDKSDHRHFCGTVICTPSVERRSLLHVVDGQQRLSTLSLLHSRLALHIGRDAFVVSGQNALFIPDGTDEPYFQLYFVYLIDN